MMARLDEQRRELAVSIMNSCALESELTPPQARLFVRSLQLSWQVPPITWTIRESHEQFADARRLLHAAEILAEIDGADSTNAISCYRRAAELLEWLSRSSDPVTRDVPASLLAAGAYQLAGLPAMATSLLKQGRFGGGLAEIVGAYLSADFERVLARVAVFWSENFELNGQPLYVRGRDEAVYLPLRIPRMAQPPAPIRNSLPHYVQIYTLWATLHLLEGSRRVLISVMQSPELIMKRGWGWDG